MTKTTPLPITSKLDFHLGCGEPLDWLSDEFIETYRALPIWYRAQVEASIPKTPLILRDEPAIEELFFVPKGSLKWTPRLNRIASLQPHHKMSEIIEQSSIIYIEAKLADCEDWQILYELPLSTPVLTYAPGHYLESALKAIDFAVNRQVCIWVDLAGADRHWAEPLKRRELIWVEGGDYE